MKNNINNLISEELKKATLLFNYDTQKTLSENIVEQAVGDKKFNFTANPEVGKGGITYNPSSTADMLKNFQSAASSTTNGQNPSPEDFTKMFQSLGQQVGAGTKIPSPEEFSKKLQSMTNKSPEEMSKMFQSMIAGGTPAAGTTPAAGVTPAAGATPAAGTTPPTSVLITKNPNDKAYDYMMKDGKYYFKGKAGTQYATKYPDWKEAKAPKGIAAIKALFDKNPKGDTPVEPTTPQNATPPTNNAEKYKEFFAQKLKDAQNLPKTLSGGQGSETPKQQNDGITDSDNVANNTQVQGQVQSNVSNDEEF
jgi:hypothetical protein